jgi:hypothetical protein
MPLDDYTRLLARDMANTLNAKSQRSAAKRRTKSRNNK